MEVPHVKMLEILRNPTDLQIVIRATVKGRCGLSIYRGPVSSHKLVFEERSLGSSAKKVLDEVHSLLTKTVKLHTEESQTHGVRVLTTEDVAIIVHELETHQIANTSELLRKE